MVPPVREDLSRALPLRSTIDARDRLVLFGIVFLALCLRLVGLGRESLWYDEAFTLRFARMSFGAMNQTLVREAWDPPVFPWLEWGWARLIGLGDWQARMVSAFFGTLAVLAIHFFARALFDVATAHLAAFLAAISQLLVAYSQEARCYAVLLFLVVATTNQFVSALREGSTTRTWCGFVGLAALASLTHYYALFALFPLALFALLFRGSHPIPLRRILGGALLYALLLAPWLASGVLSSAAGQRVAHFEYTAPWFSVDTLTFLRTMNDFHGGRMAGMLAPAALWTYPIGAVLFALPALAALWPLLPGSSLPSAKAPFALLALLWIVPMAALIALGFAHVQFATRYVSFCAAPYCVLAARGILALSPALRRVLILAIVVWSALGLRALYTIPHKEDWRGAFEQLALEVRPGDGVLFLPFGSVPLEWPVYHPDGPQLDVVGLDDVERATCDRLWVLTYERVRVDDERADRARGAVRRRWRKVRETPFFLVRVELWE